MRRALLRGGEEVRGEERCTADPLTPPPSRWSASIQMVSLRLDGQPPSRRSGSVCRNGCRTGCIQRRMLCSSRLVYARMMTVLVLCGGMGVLCAVV